MALSILDLHGLGNRRSGTSVGAAATASATPPSTGLTPLTIGLIAGTVGIVGGYMLMKKDKSSSPSGIAYESEPADKDTYAGIQREASRMRFDLTAPSLSLDDEDYGVADDEEDEEEDFDIEESLDVESLDDAESLEDDED